MYPQLGDGWAALVVNWLEKHEVDETDLMLISNQEMCNIFNYWHQKLENAGEFNENLQLKERLEFLITILFIWKTVLEISLMLIMIHE